MTAIVLLLTLNVIMAVTTLAAGIASIKLSIALSQMTKISALSTGILVGTALGVILPEGVQTLFAARETLAYLESLGLPATFVVGASILLGFVVLFITEHFFSSYDPRITFANSDLRHQRFISMIALSIMRSVLTLSLIVHSFVDGIALGASFLNENETFQLLFFLMIVIHKIPTAFSLSVILLKEGISVSMCKYHILAFAMTTPLSSLLTYLIVSMFDAKSPFVLGVLLLFSAGTFLFSVIHVMKENSSEGHSHYAIASVQTMPSDQANASEFNSSDLLFTIAGMLLPLFFSLTGAD